MFQKNKSRILDFIIKKVQQAKAEGPKATDGMEKLRLAATQVTYANLLSQYMQDSSYLFESLINLAKAYMGTESYDEAMIQARLAKKVAIQISICSKNEAVLLIAECMIKLNRYEDACEVLSGLDIAQDRQSCKINYYELLMNVLVELGQQSKVKEVQSKFEQIVLSQHGKASMEYGFFLVKKGKSLGKFAKYEEALQNLRKGMDILIDLKCRDKKQITSVYLTMADYEKRLNNLQRQFSSLTCAHAMTRQLEEPERSSLPILHALASNLIERQQYQDALKDLKKAKDIEKQLYGESSIQMAKTTKKISQIFTLLDMKGEARKYEQEYSRIIGPSGLSILKDRANVTCEQ